MDSHKVLNWEDFKYSSLTQTASPYPNYISFLGLYRVEVWVKRPYFNVNLVLKRLLTSFITAFRSLKSLNKQKVVHFFRIFDRILLIFGINQPHSNCITLPKLHQFFRPVS